MHENTKAYIFFLQKTQATWIRIKYRFPFPAHNGVVDACAPPSWAYDHMVKIFIVEKQIKVLLRNKKFHVSEAPTGKPFIKNPHPFFTFLICVQIGDILYSTIQNGSDTGGKTVAFSSQNRLLYWGHFFYLPARASPTGVP